VLRLLTHLIHRLAQRIRAMLHHPAQGVVWRVVHLLTHIRGQAIRDHHQGG
jgi:hypothetical protein